jgi:hypothetical protein
MKCELGRKLCPGFEFNKISTLVTASENDLLDLCALLEIEFSDFIINKSMGKIYRIYHF